MYANNFFSGIKFHNDEYFPYGFSCAGLFNAKEAETLSDCGYIMLQLAEGLMKPCNEEQEHFLLVVSGKIKPLYFIEHLYLKYLNYINKEKTSRSLKQMLPADLFIENLSINSNCESADNLIYSVQ